MLVITLVGSIAIQTGELEVKRRLMEPTITQNNALYLAHQRILERRFAFWRRAADRGANKPAAGMRRVVRTPSHGSRDNGG
jgi:hypothetical protein